MCVYFLNIRNTVYILAIVSRQLTRDSLQARQRGPDILKTNIVISDDAIISSFHILISI